MHESRIKINLTSTNHALKARQLFKSDFCQLLLIQKKKSMYIRKWRQAKQMGFPKSLCLQNQFLQATSNHYVYLFI